jgi:hypothetical protein
MNILPVEDDLFHADGRTDEQTEKTKLVVAFRNLSNVLKNGF